MIGSAFCKKKHNWQQILGKEKNMIGSIFWVKNIIDSTFWEKI
jgi:hypothetical protein